MNEAVHICARKQKSHKKIFVQKTWSMKQRCAQKKSRINVTIYLCFTSRIPLRTWQLRICVYLNFNKGLVAYKRWLPWIWVALAGNLGCPYPIPPQIAALVWDTLNPPNHLHRLDIQIGLLVHRRSPYMMSQVNNQKHVFWWWSWSTYNSVRRPKPRGGPWEVSGGAGSWSPLPGNAKKI